MIQNIHKNDGKPITIKDLKYITSAAWLTVFPGMTLFYPKKVCRSYDAYTHLYYIKGLDDGNASCMWRFYNCALDKTSSTPNEFGASISYINWHISKVRYLANANPSSIYKGLKINPGEVKIIVETLFIMKNPKSDKNAFGFYLISPKCTSNSSYKYYFHSIVIFTPNPGLFNDSTIPTS